MTDSERLKIAQKVLEPLQWDHEQDYCPACNADHYRGHKDGCEWMIAMGLADK